jgi:hypothetical protein
MRMFHHLNAAQQQRTGESFVYKSSSDAFRPSDYQRQGRGLHWKPPTYRPRETVSRRAASLEQGLPPAPPYEDYRI